MRGLRSKHRRWNLDLWLSVSDWGLHAVWHGKASGGIKAVHCRTTALEHRRRGNSWGDSDRIYGCFAKHSGKDMENPGLIRRCIWHQRRWVRRSNISFFPDWHRTRRPYRVNPLPASATSFGVCEDVWYPGQAAIPSLLRSNKHSQSSPASAEVVVPWRMPRCGNLGVLFAGEPWLQGSVFRPRPGPHHHESWRHGRYYW